jgi:DNA-binding MarR family transcriptional regulator
MTEFIQPETRMLDLLKRISNLPITKPPSESPLSMPQVALLNRVARAPGCGVRDIAEELHVTAPTVSVGVRRLISDGWLVQQNDPNDRRARPLYLTEKGESLMAAVHQHRAANLKMLLSGLSMDEQEQLICLLDRAVSALEEAQDQV